MGGFYPGNMDSRLANITLYAAGFDDPSVVAVPGRKGTMYVQVGTTNLWQKQDDGTTTNWLPTSGAALSAAVPRIFYASSFNTNVGDGTESNPFQSLQDAVDAVNAAAIAEAGHRTNKRFVICIHPDSRFDEDVEVAAALQLTLWAKGPWTLGDAALNDMASTTPRSILVHVDQDVEDLDGAPLNRPAFNIVSANRGIVSSTHPGYTMGATISGDLLINNGTEGNPNSNTEMNLDGVRIQGNLDGTANQSNLPLNCFFHSIFIGGFYNDPLGFLIRVVDSELDAVTCSDYSYLGR